jgi:riboflavin kinase
MNTIKVRGRVSTGKGAGRRFVAIPWARQQINEKLGFDPHLGTLNLRLQESVAKKLKETLKKLRGVEIASPEALFPARCFKALIMNIECAIILPEKPDYPPDVLEVIAPVHLRSRLSLRDGDEVEMAIS